MSFFHNTVFFAVKAYAFFYLLDVQLITDCSVVFSFGINDNDKPNEPLPLASGKAHAFKPRIGVFFPKKRIVCCFSTRLHYIVTRFTFTGCFGHCLLSSSSRQDAARMLIFARHAGHHQIYFHYATDCIK